MGCCCSRNKPEENVDGGYVQPKKKRSLLFKITIWTFSILLILILIALILLFVAVPLVFKDTIELQRLVMFPNFDQPTNPEYTNYNKYGAEGVKNIYVTVDDLLEPGGRVSLGIWQVVPKHKIEDSKSASFNYATELKESKTPILIYFHGNSGTRIAPLPTYNVIRKYFHILAFDYRSYGDSSEALLTEKAVVNDAFQLYKWVLKNTDQKDIYIWGHSLGTALSTHTLKIIYESAINGDNIKMPKGLVLEAPFTEMREEIKYHPIGKIFNWLPWFESTILNPLEKNGFHFKTIKNILEVRCPIMIMHAIDDPVIPWTLGEKLYVVANEERDPKTHCRATFHPIPASARSAHLLITQYSEVPAYIEKFIAETQLCPNKSMILPRLL